MIAPGSFFRAFPSLLDLSPRYFFMARVSEVFALILKRINEQSDFFTPSKQGGGFHKNQMAHGFPQNATGEISKKLVILAPHSQH